MHEDFSTVRLFASGSRRYEAFVAMNEETVNEALALRYRQHLLRRSSARRPLSPHLIRLLGIDCIEVAVFWAPPLPSYERREILANRTRAAILDGIRMFKAEKPNQAAGAF